MHSATLQSVGCCQPPAPQPRRAALIVKTYGIIPLQEVPDMPDL